VLMEWREAYKMRGVSISYAAQNPQLPINGAQTEIADTTRRCKIAAPTRRARRSIVAVRKVATLVILDSRAVVAKQFAHLPPQSGWALLAGGSLSPRSKWPIRARLNRETARSRR